MEVQFEISKKLEDATEFFTPERVYDGYLDGLYRQEAAEENLSRISRRLDERVDSRSVTCDDLGEYEEASRRAGFFAGFAAAQTAMQTLNAIPGEDFAEWKMTQIFRSLTTRERIKAIAYLQGLAQIH